MKAFVHLILNSEAHNVVNAGELTGAIHFYSRTRDVQELSMLKAELHSACWTKVGEGRSAPISKRATRPVLRCIASPTCRLPSKP